MADGPPYDPRAVANLLLDMADQDQIGVTPLALQKLLFFAHGRFLLQTGLPLMAGAIEAWDHGPVHPAVYHAFKSFGSAPIRGRAQARNVMTGQTAPLPEPTDPRVRTIVRQIVGSMGHLPGAVLRAISHAPGGPWSVARGQAIKGMSVGARITDDITRQAFHKQTVAIGSGGVDEVLRRQAARPDHSLSIGFEFSDTESPPLTAKIPT